MLLTRLIPCLLLKDNGLYKTRKFKNPGYVGDPINTVKIFNDKEVDELIFLDIQASVKNREPDFKSLSEIANECFMPLAYGGGLKNIEQVKKLFNIGVEKVAINTQAIERPQFVTDVANLYGAQSVIGSIDVKSNLFGKKEVVYRSATQKHKLSPVEWAKQLESLGAGELLVTSVDREGTWSGYDIDLIKSITSEVGIPVICNGGAGNIGHLVEAINKGGAAAAAMGSMVVYQKKDFGVLISFPDKKEFEKLLVK